MMEDSLTFDSGTYGNGIPMNGCISYKQFKSTIALLVATLVDVAVLSSAGGFYPFVALSKGMSVTLVGVIMGMVSMASLLFTGLCGRLLRTTGTRFMVLAGLFLISGAAFAQSTLMFTKSGVPFLVTSLMCHFVKGLGFLSRCTGVVAMISADFEARLALYMGLYHLASGVGASIGPVIGGVLYDKYGFASGFYVPGAMGAVAFIFVFFTLRSSSVYRSDGKIDFKDNSASHVNEVKVLLKYPPFYITLLSTMNSVLITVAFGTTIAIYVTQQFLLDYQFKLSSIEASSMLFVYHGVAVLFAPVIGHLADKLGIHEKLLVTGHVLTIIGLLIMGPVKAVPLKPKEWLTFFGAAVTSLGASTCFISSIQPLHRLTHRLHLTDVVNVKSTVSSGVVFAINLGSLIGPLIGGAFVDHIGFRDCGLYLAIISGVIGLMNAACFFYMNFIPGPPDEHAIDHEEARSLMEDE